MYSSGLSGSTTGPAERNENIPQLAEWDSFYVIVGSSAGALM
jgi:hypothetical protein